MDSAPPTETRPPMSQPLATLKAAVDQYQAGNLADEAMQSALTDFEERLQHLELPADMPGAESGQAGVRQALQYHHTLLAEYRSGFEELNAGLEAPDVEATAKALERMAHIDAILRHLFVEIQGRYQEHQRQAEAASVVTCPRCGTKNARGQSACKQCRFMLPSLNERTETDVTGGGGGEVVAAVQELRALVDRWQMNQDRMPLAHRLEEQLHSYTQGLARSKNVLQASQLDEEVMTVVRQTIDTLQGLIEAVELAQALVVRNDAGSLDGAFASMEANLQDLDALRAQFKELEQRFKA